MARTECQVGLALPRPGAADGRRDRLTLRYLYPEYRVTASQLSAIVNGMATLILFIPIDPQLSVMTDDGVAGKVDEPVFRRTIVWFSISQVAGTLLAELLFLPAALVVVAAAKAF